MAERTCLRCGGPLPIKSQGPRKYCYTCSPRRVSKTRSVPCAECGEPTEGRLPEGERMCSPCRIFRRIKLCPVCGAEFRQVKTSRGPLTQTCSKRCAGVLRVSAVVRGRREEHTSKSDVPDRRLDYQSAHHRLRAERGRASDHPCSECTKQADEWAYDHEDPNEVEGHTRRGRVAVYSEDPHHYRPMCRSCHSLHDRAHWFARRLAPVLDSHGIDPEVRDTILKEIKNFR